MPSIFKALFSQDYERHEGVPRVNIYLMRLVYALMLVFLGKDSWTYILTHQGDWESLDAMAWSVWAAFASFSLIGLIRPVRMIPIMCLEVFYKLIWLLLVAYPLWRDDRLAGSTAEGMTHAFLWVLLPIIALPWRYVFNTYVLVKQLDAGQNGQALRT
jgi:hypothetical protein